MNLAFSDLLKSLFALPMVAVSSYYGHWIFNQWGDNVLIFYFKWSYWLQYLNNLTLKGQKSIDKFWIYLHFKIFILGCDLYGFCGAFFGFGNITTLSLMSIERYIVVKYPFMIYSYFSRYFKMGMHYEIVIKLWMNFLINLF